jgi:uncharacterized membrane protein
MNNISKEQFLIEAKKRAKRNMIFYLHLVGYIVVVALLLYNLYIVAGPYKNNIISLNLSILVAWTIFIIIHGLNIFKGKQIYKKNWEDKKIEKFLKEENEEVEMTFWE